MSNKPVYFIDTASYYDNIDGEETAIVTVWLAKECCCHMDVINEVVYHVPIKTLPRVFDKIINFTSLPEARELQESDKTVLKGVVDAVSETLSRSWDVSPYDIANYVVFEADEFFHYNSVAAFDTVVRVLNFLFS